MRQFKPIVHIPTYLILGIGDDGISNIELDDGSTEKDDLRVCITLSGGTDVLLDDCRMIVSATGITIESLVPTNGS